MNELSKRVSGAPSDPSAVSNDYILLAVHDLVVLEQQMLSKRESFEAAESAIATSPDLVINKIVLHFKNLFAVKDLEGMFPRINEV